jgi:hypothetical protein
MENFYHHPQVHNLELIEKSVGEMEHTFSIFHRYCYWWWRWWSIWGWRCFSRELVQMVDTGGGGGGLYTAQTNAAGGSW